MFTKVNDFLQEWGNESQATHKILKALTDASLQQKVYDQGRTLGRIAWHIVVSVGEMGQGTGLSFEAPGEKDAVPTSAQAIAAAYEKSASALAAALQAQWNDARLQEEIELYGEKWTRGFTLNVLIKHEIHHRAQLTVLMRQAGVKVPGIYGPAREEWSAYGAPAAE